MTRNYGCLYLRHSLWLKYDSRFLLAENTKNMNEITEKIISYIKSKYTYNYKKWHIGFTEDIKKTKKEYQSSKEIVCEYVKTWPCQNQKQASQVLKEVATLGLTVCNSKKSTTIFVFLAITKEGHKGWKILNTQKPVDFLILK